MEINITAGMLAGLHPIYHGLHSSGCVSWAELSCSFPFLCLKPRRELSPFVRHQCSLSLQPCYLYLQDRITETECWVLKIARSTVFDFILPFVLILEVSYFLNHYWKKWHFSVSENYARNQLLHLFYRNKNCKPSVYLILKVKSRIMWQDLCKDASTKNISY